MSAKMNDLNEIDQLFNQSKSKDLSSSSAKKFLTDRNEIILRENLNEKLSSKNSKKIITEQ